MNRRRLSVKRGLLLLCALPAMAQAWDAAGHMLVGEIAWETCTPKARAAVRELVSTLDNQFNAGNPYNFITAPCWMDDLRSLPREKYLWGKWHYVDSEKTDDGKDFKLPEPPHVVWAIGENLKTLHDSAASKEDRAKALGMLMHFVGDVHQPLHATTWNDQGGNGYVIMGVPFTDLFPRAKPNLHTFWDKAFRFDGKDGQIVQMWKAPDVADRPKSPGETIIAEEAAKLMKQFPRESLDELKAKGTAEDWARESHVIGCTKAYPPGDHPHDIEVRKLEPDFVHQSQEIAARRVTVAGYRLADLLNELFP